MYHLTSSGHTRRRVVYQQTRVLFFFFALCANPLPYHPLVTLPPLQTLRLGFQIINLGNLNPIHARSLRSQK